MEESIQRVAARIKQWRTEAGFSLQELGNRAGVSPSTIHKIEHCQTVPTIAVVLKLASGLGRHATELFEEKGNRSNAIHTPANSQLEVVTSGGARVRALAGDPSLTELGVWRVIQPPGFHSSMDPGRNLPGELVVIVEGGELEVTISGEPFKLRAGDSLVFKASQSYSWRNLSNQPASALVLGSVDNFLEGARVGQLRRLSAPEPSALPA